MADKELGELTLTTVDKDNAARGHSSGQWLVCTHARKENARDKLRSIGNFALFDTETNAKAFIAAAKTAASGGGGAGVTPTASSAAGFDKEFKDLKRSSLHLYTSTWMAFLVDVVVTVPPVPPTPSDPMVGKAFKTLLPVVDSSGAKVITEVEVKVAVGAVAMAVAKVGVRVAVTVAVRVVETGVV